MRHNIIKTKVTFLAILGLLLLSLALAACGEATSTNLPAATTGATVPAKPTTTLPPVTVPPTTTSVAGATPTTTASTPPTPAASPSPAPATRPVETPTATATPVKTFKPVIWFSSATLKIGDTLTVSGSGYPANTNLQILLTQ